jgi:hypothetical protein
MKKTCAMPLCNPGPPPGGVDQGVPVEPYSVLTLKAKTMITVQGGDYMFYGWLVELTPPKQGSELYRDNPLQLFVDDNMQVKAIYVQLDCGK